MAWVRLAFPRFRGRQSHFVKIFHMPSIKALSFIIFYLKNSINNVNIKLARFLQSSAKNSQLIHQKTLGVLVTS